MSITPRYGRQDLETMRDRLDRLIGDLGGRTLDLLERSMPIDLCETESEIIVKASVPGVDPEHLDIQFAEGMLTIRATMEEETDEETGTWHVRERRTGMTERSIQLPRSADIENADASIENGVLRITFPISDGSSRKRIQVRSSKP